MLRFLPAACAAIALSLLSGTARAQLTPDEYCRAVVDQVKEQFGAVGLSELIRASIETSERMAELQREIEALNAQWQNARYEHEQDEIAERLAFPELLWNRYRARLDCIDNLIEQFFAIPPSPRPEPTLEDKRKAEEAKKRKQEAERFGDMYKIRFDEARKRRVPGGPFDTGINVGGGVSVGYLMPPDIEFGRNGGNSGPYHKGDSDVVFTQGSFDISMPAFGGPDAAGGWRFGLNVLGEIGDHLQKFGDSTDAGFITIINGSNPALTPIAASQDARVKTQWWSIAVNPYLEWRKTLDRSAWLKFQFGPRFEHQNLDYRFREMVSGGGPFFSHELEYDFRVNRYGVKLGVGIEQRLGGGFGWRAEGFVVPSWRDLELRARQSGTALSGAKVRDNDNGFGLTGGVEAGVWWRLAPGVRVDIGGGGLYRSDAPEVRYPDAGGQRLRSRSGGAFEAMAKAQITIRLSDSPIRDVFPK